MAPSARSYEVVLSSQARHDMKESADGERARLWTGGLLDALESLAKMPARYAVAPESQDVGMEVRHLVYFSHRIIFRIDEATGTVQILRVYHGARLPLQSEDLA